MLGTLTRKDGTTVTLPELDLNRRRAAWLQALDAEPAPLHEYLDRHCRSPRLGLVFEALWHFFLEEDPQTELLAHNLPVRNGGQTLGEFDVLYYCHHRRAVFHLELAVKFYLATDARARPDDPLSQWLGPNCQDRLDLKLARLLDHQLQLADTHEGRRALAAAGIDAVMPELRMAGWLFQSGRGEIALPPEVQATHPGGIWVTVTEFERHYRQRFERWYALRKPRWLDGVAGGEPLGDHTLEAARRRPQMLIGARGDTPGVEVLRMFVTPDDWPKSV